MSGVATREAPEAPAWQGRRPARLVVPVAVPCALALVLGLVLLRPELATVAFLQAKTNGMLPLFLVAAGLTLVVLAGELDLSVAGLVSLGNCIAASCMTDAGASVAGWTLACLAIGVAGGLVNGLLVAVLGVGSLITTLATWSLFSGAAFLVMEAEGGRVAAPLRALTGQVLGVPMSLLIGLALLGSWLLLARSVAGRWLYATGSDPARAALSGVPVTGVRLAAFAASGGLAALAGVYRTVQVGAGAPDAGNGLLLPAATAVVIGGTLLRGGKGGIGRTLAGVVTLLALSDLVFFSGVKTFYTPMLQGALLIGVVVAAAVAERHRDELS